MAVETETKINQRRGSRVLSDDGSWPETGIWTKKEDVSELWYMSQALYQKHDRIPWNVLTLIEVKLKFWLCLAYCLSSKVKNHLEVFQNIVKYISQWKRRSCKKPRSICGFNSFLLVFGYNWLLTLKCLFTILNNYLAQTLIALHIHQTEKNLFFFPLLHFIAE